MTQTERNIFLKDNNNWELQAHIKKDSLAGRDFVHIEKMVFKKLELYRLMVNQLVFNFDLESKESNKLPKWVLEYYFKFEGDVIEKLSLTEVRVLMKEEDKRNS